MSQDTDPYRTELIHFARMQANTLPSVPHMHFLHTLEGLAQRAARDSALASTVNGRISFYNEQYGITYEIDHSNRRIVVTDVSPI